MSRTLPGTFFGTFPQPTGNLLGIFWNLSWTLPSTSPNLPGTHPKAAPKPYTVSVVQYDLLKMNSLILLIKQISRRTNPSPREMERGGGNLRIIWRLSAFDSLTSQSKSFEQWRGCWALTRTRPTPHPGTAPLCKLCTPARVTSANTSIWQDPLHRQVSRMSNYVWVKTRLETLDWVKGRFGPRRRVKTEMMILRVKLNRCCLFHCDVRMAQ